MKKHLLIVIVLIAAMYYVVCAAPKAQAWDGCNGGWGYSAWDMGYLYNSLAYNVPYFAAFPPVYYSYPVPRTYGYSPFAYPPGVMTPEVVMGAEQPIEIINPYVPGAQQEKAKSQADQTASVRRAPEPLVILNPYATGRAVANVVD